MFSIRSFAFAAPVLAAAVVSSSARAAEFPAGHLFVTTFVGNRVLEYDASGTLLASFGSGTPLSGPWGLAFDCDGTLAVASRTNDEVITFAPGNTFVIGNGSIELDGPQGLAIGPAGRLYVASTHNDAIVAFGTSFSPFTIIHTSASFPIDGPTMLSFTADNRLLVGSFFNNLVCECTDNGFATAILPGLAQAPESVSLSGAGTMLLVSSANQTIRALAASKFLLPELDLAPPGLVTPMGAVEGPDGRIYVASSGNDRVLVLNGTDVVPWGTTSFAAPVGLAFAPWWFTVRIQGDVLPSQSTIVATVDETARLALFPGSGRAFIVFEPPSATTRLAANFGSHPLVFHGTEHRDAKGNKQRVFHGQQRSLDFSSTPTASLGIAIKQKTVKGVLDLTSAKGTLHISDANVIFRGTIKTLAPLN